MNSCYNDKFFQEKWGGLGRPSRPASDGPARLTSTACAHVVYNVAEQVFTFMFLHSLTVQPNSSRGPNTLLSCSRHANTQANRVIKVSSIISCMQATIILHSSVSLLSTGTMALMCVQSVEGSLLCTPRTVSYSYKLSHLVTITQGFEVNLSTGEKAISCTCLALLHTGLYHFNVVMSTAYFQWCLHVATKA